MLKGQELVAVENMRRARHVAGDEDVVSHHSVDVEGAAAGITADAPLSGGQSGAVEPLHVAD